MQSGKVLILVAVAIALFAVLQSAESKSVSDEAKDIEKHVDDEIKKSKMSKRAAEDEDDGGKHKKGKKKKAGSTEAPKSTTAAPGASTTAKPGASTTTGKPGASTTTGKPGASSTTKASASAGSTTSPTGHPDEPKGGSTTASPKGGSSSTKKADILEKDKEQVAQAREKQSQERDIIRKIFKETMNWKKWLEDNNRKTMNPKAAKATWELAEKVNQIITKPTRFYGKFNSEW